MKWLGLGALLLAVAPAAVHGDDRGLLVAVGYGGRRMVSYDGLKWQNDQRWSDHAADNDDVLFNVAFGAGQFVAVGGGVRLGHILSTRDGIAWKTVQEVQGCVATVAFGNGRFVAAHDAELMVSADGGQFEAGARLDWKGSVHARRSACGDTEAGFRFVIIGDIDLWQEKRRVHWRGVAGADGTRWVHSALETPAAVDIAYGAGQFVVVGPGGLIESSHDGQNWQRLEITSPEDFSRVVWTGNQFLVSGGQAAWSSPDGLAWTRQSAGIPCSIAWARGGFGAIGFSWGGNIWFSPDFITWRKAEMPAGPSLNAVAFGRP